MNTLRNVITALITPFDADNAIDYVALEKLIEWQLDEGVSGLVMAGTTGESPTLSAAEKLDLFRFTVKQINGRVPVIAGTGSNDTRASIEFSKQAADTGVDAALVVVPYYNKPSQRGLIAHFTAIADQGELPVVMYNVPSRTITDLAHETALTLAEHDNIIAIKEATTSSRMVALRQALPSDFAVLSGDDAQTADAICDAAHAIDGVISVTSNIAPKLLSDMCVQAKTDKATARAINTRLSALHRDLFCDANPAPAKYALSRAGRIENHLRLPLLPLSAELAGVVDAAMHDVMVN